MLIDFISSSGEKGLKEHVFAQIQKNNLDNAMFLLTKQVQADCLLCAKYDVKEGPCLVAVDIQNPENICKMDSPDATNLINFINQIREVDNGKKAIAEINQTPAILAEKARIANLRAIRFAGMKRKASDKGEEANKKGNQKKPEFKADDPVIPIKEEDARVAARLEAFLKRKFLGEQADDEAQLDTPQP